MILVEAQMHQHKLNDLKIKIDFSGMFAMNPIGRRG